MRFECKSDIKIFHRNWHSRDDLACGVSYWVNYLSSKYNVNHGLPLGVAHGVITFSSICCYLALYKIKMPFTCIDSHNVGNDRTPCQAKIILGEPFASIESKIDIDCTDYFLHGLAMGRHQEHDDLVFELADDHLIFSYTSGSTSTKKSVITKASHEGAAVQTAIDQYFSCDDVCLFSHEMTHRGVHTTAILPALFSASEIMFVNAQEWPRVVTRATHCQWFPIMRDYFKLTPNIKKITVGGSKIDDETADYLLTHAPDATIYDIYGLTECLPPLAIRKLTTIDRPNKFKICRPDLKFADNGQLTITDNNNIIKTGDHVEFVSDTDFKFIGRVKQLVRVNGHLHNQTDLQILLGKNIPIDQFSLNINQEKLILQVTGNTDQYVEWCQKNHVENFNVTKVDRVATSGGIKTVNNSEYNVS